MGADAQKLPPPAPYGPNDAVMAGRMVYFNIATASLKLKKPQLWEIGVYTITRVIKAVRTHPFLSLGFPKGSNQNKGAALG